MEHVHTRDNNSSPDPHPTENPTAPPTQIDPFPLTQKGKEPDAERPAPPSPSPPTANLHGGDKSRVSILQSLRRSFTNLRLKPPRSKPLFRGFERPSLSRIAILAVLCLITYPAFYVLTLVAKDRSLSMVRAIVSVWCSIVGFALGYVLLKIGTRHLEAATWATVIHMSHEGGGMKLRDLVRGSRSPASFMPAFCILLSRFGNRETARSSRKSYDKRPWSLFLGFFIVLSMMGPLLPFLFGRVIGIKTFTRNQRKVYREVLIAGDLSKEDIDQRNSDTVGPTDLAGPSPTAVDEFDTTEFVYGNDTVYFAQPSLSQFTPGGYGHGTFDPASVILRDPPNNTLAFTGRDAPKGDTGVVLRYSQWGIRIHCEKLPDLEINLVPFLNYTYVFIPQDFLRRLFGVYGMDLPTEFTKPDFQGIRGNDTIPPNIDPLTVSYVVDVDNDAVSLHSRDPGAKLANQGWVTIETVVIQIDTSFAPSGRFPVYFNLSGTQTRIGYDTAVCVQLYEPWITEAHNTSTGSPSTLRIVEKGDCSTSLSPSGDIRGIPISNTRCLNTTGKDHAFHRIHQNSFDLLSWALTGKSPDDPGYIPPPVAVYFTKGAVLQEYTELSPDRFGVIRARVAAATALPYFVGSGPAVAQSYEDETLAYATYIQWQLITLPILVWILGIIGELFAPILPLNIPRRGFGVYTWLAVFKSHEVQFEAADDLDKFMDLDELEEEFSDKRVKFVA